MLSSNFFFLLDMYFCNKSNLLSTSFEYKSEVIGQSLFKPKKQNSKNLKASQLSEETI